MNADERIAIMDQLARLSDSVDIILDAIRGINDTLALDLVETPVADGADMRIVEKPPVRAKRERVQ